MFTLIAFLGVAGIGWQVTKMQDKDIARVPGIFDDDIVRESVVHSRQDFRLIAYLLSGIVIMLGIIADRIH